MSGRRSADAFRTARAEGRAALVGYLPAGFPTFDDCVQSLTAMVRAGVDIVEVGLPYSDPVLDGPVIQAAAEAALRGGTKTADVFRTVEAVAAAGAAVVVMTYWNPVLRYGVDAFARDLAAAGGSGLITPDLIPDEGQEWIEVAQRHDLDRVFLVAPSTTPERMKLTTDACAGWVYAASTMGVTGARTTTSSAAPELVARTRRCTDLPVAVGLGVSSREQAAEVASYADGVIVGSALVRAVGERGAVGAAELAAELAEGVRR